MIGIVIGAVIGIGTIVFLSLQKPAQQTDTKEQQNEEQKNENDNKQDETQVVLTKEEIEAKEMENRRLYQESLKRRENLLRGLSNKERELFENYIDEVQGKKGDNSKQDGDSLLIEIVVIAAGLLLVYAMVVILGDTYYSPIQIFYILKAFFVPSSFQDDGAIDSSTNSSPFQTSPINNQGNDL